MITRDQLEHERRIQVASWHRCHPESRESVANLLKIIDLALRALDLEAERDAALAEIVRLRKAMPSDDEMPFVRAAIVRYMRSVRRIPDGAPEREMGMRAARWLDRIKKARGE